MQISHQTEHGKSHCGITEDIISVNFINNPFLTMIAIGVFLFSGGIVWD